MFRGLFLGFKHKRLEFTAYVFNAGFTDPTVILEVGAVFETVVGALQADKP